MLFQLSYEKMRRLGLTSFTQPSNKGRLFYNIYSSGFEPKVNAPPAMILTCPDLRSLAQIFLQYDANLSHSRVTDFVG